MARTSSMHVRVEPKIKEEAEKILKKLGMTSSEAINIYLKQIILNSGIPFDVKIPQFNDDMLEAIAESKDLEENPNKYKKYNNIKDLMEDLESE